jgi:hypothetical protein
MFNIPVLCGSDESSASSSSTIFRGVARAEYDFFIVSTDLQRASKLPRSTVWQVSDVIFFQASHCRCRGGSRVKVEHSRACETRWWLDVTETLQLNSMREHVHVGRTAGVFYYAWHSRHSDEQSTSNYNFFYTQSGDILSTCSPERPRNSFSSYRDYRGTHQTL